MALNKDSQDRLNSIKQEEQLQRSLQKMLSDRVTKGKELTNSQKEFSLPGVKPDVHNLAQNSDIIE